MQWTMEMNGEGESGKSVLVAWHDADNDIYWTILNCFVFFLYYESILKIFRRDVLDFSVIIYLNFTAWIHLILYNVFALMLILIIFWITKDYKATWQSQYCIAVCTPIFSQNLSNASNLTWSLTSLIHHFFFSSKFQFSQMLHNTNDCASIAH